MAPKGKSKSSQTGKLALELEKSEARFRSIIQKSADGIVIVDSSGLIYFVNPAAERLFCRKADELMHEAFGFPVVAGETTELDILCGGGKVNFVEMRVTETQWDGKDALLATLRDITERKKARQEIEQLNRSLSARAAELENLNRELEAFTYAASHDLRSPLNVISLTCQAIWQIYGDKMTEECNNFVLTIYNTTMKMDQLIDALLNLSRLSHTEPYIEVVDMSLLARTVAEDLRLSQPERKTVFRIGDGITVQGDLKLMRVVMSNLLGNAWKYTGKQEDGIIEFGENSLNGSKVFYVRDNGPGFDKSEAKKLFIPFYRLSRAMEYKGFGVGLATVERIIRRHGGRVWAEGEPGKGATFNFTLNGNFTKETR